MITSADMIKNIPATGVVTDRTPDLFTRNDQNEHGQRFRGFATFGTSGSVILEVADTPVLKARGLMGRISLPACCGMIFTDLSGGYFWMKGCKIPLDIVFISDSSKVSLLYTMDVDNGENHYSYGDEKVAIELPAGFCARHKITQGTVCDWRVW